MGTEDGSTRCTRGIYPEDEKGNISSTAVAKGVLTDQKLKDRAYMPAYDIIGTATAEHWWNYYYDRPYMSGSFVWTGFDYRGEPTPYKWPCINSHFGILDTCGFPKDNFFYYQAWWTDKPVVHVFPHWNWLGKEGKTIDVWVHSNADEIELTLNGELIGRQKVEPRKHLEWKVPYTPGTLVARGFRGGKEIAQDKVETTGAPAKLIVAPDRSEISADGEDISVVNVSVVDDKGRVVPTAGNLVKFGLTGDAKIIGVGNGDPRCREPDRASERSAFCGLCMAIVQAGRQPDVIKLTVSSEGLQSATLTLKTASVQPRAAVPVSN
jgi:beta-galactosidase